MTLFPANRLYSSFAATMRSHTLCADAAEWASKYRFVSGSISAHSGNWDNSYTPYLVGIMQAASIGDPCTHVIVKGSNQIGKTECILNIAGYRIHQWPVPMMIVLAKDEEIPKYVEARIDPFIKTCSVLRPLVGKTEDGDKAADNSKQKRYPGGQLYVASSWSPNTFREKPLGIVVIDDVDACRPPVEGDIMDLAFKRTNTFSSKARKVIAVSTPTEEGSSTISVEYENSSQRIFEIPCPQCGAYFALWRSYFKYKDQPVPHFQCPHCESAVYEDQRAWMVSRGSWNAQRPELVGRREGFWIWAAYAPFVRWQELADGLVEAFAHRKVHGQDGKLQARLNLDWGETYIPPEQLRLRGIEQEVYNRREMPFMMQQLPMVCIASGSLAGHPLQTSGTDVQKDRLEISRLGWGAKRECWTLEHKVIRGSFDSDATWDEWAEYLIANKVSCCCVDASAYQQAVCDQVTRRMVRLFRAGCAIYAIKGRAGPGLIWPKYIQPGNVIDDLAHVVTVYVDNGKDWVYESLENIKDPGPSYLHFDTNVGKDFFRQIYGERRRTSTDPKSTSKYIEVQGRRNEALDITVYGYVALWARATFDHQARRVVLSDFDHGDGKSGSEPDRKRGVVQQRQAAARPARRGERNQGRKRKSWVNKRSL